MSTIDFLQLQGVRSYAPDKPAKIRFSKPLTVIVGANGCGKTSIIECLKLACCGTYPADSSRGRLFVHDVDLVGGTDVRGKVHLSIRTATGQCLQVMRLMSVVRSGKTLKFSTQDTTLLQEDTHGTMRQSTHKHADADAKMIDAIGVPKAILESVIFCHQEDSNWPLQDDASVQKKLDAIFDSKRYVDAITAFSKKITELTKTAAEYKADLARTEELQKEAAVQRGNRAETQDRVTELEAQSQRLKQELETAQERAAARQTEHEQAQQRASRVEALEREAEGKSGEVQRARGGMDRIIDCSDEELDRALDDVKRKETTAGGEQRALETAATRARNEVAAKDRECNQLQRRVGHLSARVDELRKARATRSRELRRVAESMGTEASPAALEEAATQADVQPFLDRLHRTVDEVGEAHRRVEGECEALVSASERDVAQRQRALAAAEQGTRAVDQRKSDLMQELREVRSRRATHKNVERRLQSAKKRATTAESSLTHVTEQMERHRQQAALPALQRRVRELEGKVEEAGEQVQVRFAEAEGAASVMLTRTRVALLQAAESGGAAASALAHAQEVLAAREAELKEAKESHGVEIARVLGERGEVDPFTAVQRVNDEANARTRVQEESESGLAEAREEAALARAEVEAAQRKRKELVEDCGGFADDLLAVVQRACEEHNVDPKEPHKAATKAHEAAEKAAESSFIVNGFPKFLGIMLSSAKQRRVCPCCTRPLDDEQLRVTQDNVKERQKQARSKSEASKQEVEDKRRAAKHVQEAAPKYERWWKLKHEDVPEAETALARAQEAATRAESAVAEKEAEVESRRKARRDANLMEVPASKLEAAARNAKAAKEKVEECRAQADAQAAARDGPSREELRQQHDALKRDLQRAREELQGAEREERELQDAKQKAELEVANAKAAVAEAQFSATEAQHAAEREQACQTQLETVAGDEQRASAAEEERRSALRRAEEELSQKREARRKREQESRQRVERAREGLQAARSAVEAVSALESAGVEEELAETDRGAKRAAEQRSESQRRLEEAEEGLRKQRDAVAKKEAARRTLEANVSYRELRKEEEELRERARAAAQERDRGVSVDQARRAAEGARQERDRVLGDVHRVEGQLQSAREELERLENRITRDFGDASSRFSEALTAYELTRTALEDMKALRKAVDQALHEYQTLKMEQINSSIKQLWTNTYMGEDIDHVQIREEVSTRASKRSFRYRVVMVKNGTEMDMRGRCSAGQKVLACLIIRMALAETFSANCGILTLDEPTTNLDEENKRGLAKSLSRLLRMRRGQTNFQLIVITHDIQFVNELGMASQTEQGVLATPHVWSVTREPSDNGSGAYHSVIRRTPLRIGE